MIHFCYNKNVVKRIIALTTLVVFLFFNCPSFAQNPLPKQIEKEKKDFLESQISSPDKLFLDQLGVSFQHLAKITTHALEIVNSVPTISKLTHRQFINSLQAKTKKIIPELNDRKKSGQKLRTFIQKNLGKGNNLRSDFRRLLTSYNEIKGLKSSFGNDFVENLPTEGIYRYYTLCSKTLEYSPSEILDQMVIVCNGFAKVAKQHKIEKLKRLLPGKIIFLEKSYNALEDKLVDHLKYMQSGWGQEMVLRIVKLVQQQITLCKDFSKSVFGKLKSIPEPKDPLLPDFQIISIGVASTDTIAVGDEITIVVVVKNMGQLSTGSSKTKVFFPNGKTKIISVPKLGGEQTYLKTLRYKLDRTGRNEFTVMVNHDFKAWESNTSNNLTKRAIILQ